MVPQFFIELKDDSTRKDFYKKYFNDQYPDTKDCNILDAQMKNIHKDLAEIEFRKDSNYKEMNGPVIIKVPCVVGVDFMCNTAGKTKSISNPDYSTGMIIRQKSQDYLASLYYLKEAEKSKCISSNNEVLKTENKQNTEDIVVIDPITGVKTIIPGSKKKNNTILYLAIGITVISIGLGYWYYKTQKK